MDDNRTPQMLQFMPKHWSTYPIIVDKKAILASSKCPWPHRGAGSPVAIAPISVSSVSGSNWPLNLGKYAASVYGQRTEGEFL